MSLSKIVEKYLNSLLNCHEVENKALLDDEIVRVKQFLHLVKKADVLPPLPHVEDVTKSDLATADIKAPELRGEAIEVLSCVIANDNIEDVSLMGDITINKDKLNYEGDIFIKFKNLKPHNVNTAVLSPCISEGPFVFKLNRNSPEMTENGSVKILKYTVTNPPQIQCPILITPVWQFKEEETICMVNLRPLLAVHYTLLKVNINIGEDAFDILSKPSGLYNKTKEVIQWDLFALEKDEIIILRYKTNKTNSATFLQTTNRKPYVSIDFTSSQLLSEIEVEYGTSPANLSALPLNTLTISSNYRAT